MILPCDCCWNLLSNRFSFGNLDCFVYLCIPVIECDSPNFFKVRCKSSIHRLSSHLWNKIAVCTVFNLFPVLGPSVKSITLFSFCCGTTSKGILFSFSRKTNNFTFRSYCSCFCRRHCIRNRNIIIDLFGSLSSLNNNIDRELPTLELSASPAHLCDNFRRTAIRDMHHAQIILRSHSRCIDKYANRNRRFNFFTICIERNVNSTNAFYFAFDHITYAVNNGAFAHCGQLHLCAFRERFSRCHNAHNHSVGANSSEHFLFQSSLQLLVRSFFCFFRFRLRFRFGL